MSKLPRAAGHAGYRLATCWLQAGYMLATCWPHAGYMLCKLLPRLSFPLSRAQEKSQDIAACHVWDVQITFSGLVANTFIPACLDGILRSSSRSGGAVVQAGEAALQVAEVALQPAVLAVPS